VLSFVGESIISVGSVIWLATQTASPLIVTLAVLALGAPYVLAGLLFARMEHVEHPGGPMRWVGWLRTVLALGLAALQFQFSVPAALGLLFMISLTGRLHDRLRIAAERTCLALGETEHVASDLQIGLSIAAVVGPLLAMAFYILPGENSIGLGVGACLAFLLCSNSEGFLDTLPPHRRDYLLAVPVEADAETDDLTEHEENATGAVAAANTQERLDETDPEMRREQALPEWFQQTPRSPVQVIADIRGGLALAGSEKRGTLAIQALALLGLAGGGLSVLEVYFVQTAMGLSAFYLGALLAVEAAGLALGALMADLFGERKTLVPLFAGLSLAGVALVSFVYLPLLPLILVPALFLGVANALAVQRAHRALLGGFSGAERRALGSAARAVSTFAGLFGAALFGVAYAGHVAGPITSKLPLPNWSAAELVFVTGLALILSPALLIGGNVLAARKRKPKEPAEAEQQDSADGFTGEHTGLFGRLADADDDQYAESGAYEMDAEGYEESAVYEWDEQDSRASRSYSRYRNEEAWNDDEERDDDPRGSRDRWNRRPPRSPRW
jgi:hypothetical protein